MNHISRRQFLQSTAHVSASFFGLRRLFASNGYSAPSNMGSRFGPLVSDPRGIVDLPDKFSYSVMGRVGDFMTDGLRTPGAPDGMGTFAGKNGKTIIVRNHEVSPESSFTGAFGTEYELMNLVDNSMLYDAGKGVRPALGGTSTIVYDTKTRTVEKEFMSLLGTTRNCAGGVTPWQSWVTCEETVERAGEFAEHDHGYAFEVPATTEIKLHKAVPITEMGRFNHEAIAVEPRTGIVYLTEDRSDGLLYRYLPKKRAELYKGGKLQVLAVRGRPSADTRNWDEESNAYPVNEPISVGWIDIDGIQSPDDDLRYRGFESGAAVFARGEGIWFGNGEFYFACTSGGRNKTGQIFRYIPSKYEGHKEEERHPARLELFLEPNDNNHLENGDNLTVAPWGDLFICEDGSENDFLRGVTLNGEIYNFAYNHYNQSEFAGVCFSPDGSTMFVNIQGPGITLAISGPWTE